MSLHPRNHSLWVLTAGFSIILALIIALGLIASEALLTAEENLERVVKVTNEKIASAHAMRDSIRLRAVALREARLTDDSFQKDQIFIDFMAYAGDFRDASKRLTAMGLDKRESDLYERFRTLAREGQPYNFEAMQLILEDAEEARITRSFDYATRLQREIIGVLGELIELELQYAEDARNEGVSQQKAARSLLLAISFLIIVTGIIIAFAVIKVVHKGTEQIHYQARHDPLTDLSNRHEFEEYLDEAVDSARTLGHTHIVLYMDLDDFKIINDTCGHAAGDNLLQGLSREFQKAVRSTDILARLGGDEFGVLLKNCGIDAAISVAEKIRQAVEKYHLEWQGNTYSVGVSIGVVAVDGSTEDRATVMKHADAACYMAKDLGRNRVYAYAPDEQELMEKTRDLHCLNCLTEAIEHDGFRLYAQRITPLGGDTGEGLQAEILLRLFKDGEIHMPAEFMSPAERFHLMPQVDRWVVDHTIDWLMEDRQRADSINTLYISLSGASLNDAHFMDYLGSRLSQAQEFTNRIGFEITENIAIRNLENTRELISRLKQYGCKVSLDDFGVGMSSFVYLKALDVDIVKIDGEFVRGVVDDEVDYEIVRLINEFCHTLGISTVAEYVESPEILQTIETIGVDRAQGNHIMEAAPLESLFENYPSKVDVA